MGQDPIFFCAARAVSALDVNKETAQHGVSSRKSLLLLERAALEFNDKVEDNS
jgi:hypothetical protein